MNKKSIFAKFLLNSLSFFDTVEALYKRIQTGEESILSDIKLLEEQKIFNIARFFETSSKAFLATYGIIIVYPVFLISTVERERLKCQRQFQKILNSLRTLLRQAANTKKIIEKLKHDPIGKSQISDLLITTANFLRCMQKKELAEVYENIANFLKKSASERNYSDLFRLRNEITRVIQFRNEYEQLLSLIRKCLEEQEEDEVCKNLPDESKKMLEVYKEKPYLIDQILLMLDLSLQELFDGLLHTAYLARAAETADYIIGREEADEKYLEEVRDHQKEIMEVMRRFAEINSRLVRSGEVDNFIAEVESEIRKILKAKT